jgi:hypothetical protein
MIVNEPNTFGGGWSDLKLQTLAEYLHAFTTACRKVEAYRR